MVDPAINKWLQTNCVHEFFPEEALAQARDLDKYYAEHNTTVGPLHGLPISLKDQLRVKVRDFSLTFDVINSRANHERQT